MTKQWRTQRGVHEVRAPPYFSANTLESPLNWLKYTKNIAFITCPLLKYDI